MAIKKIDKAIIGLVIFNAFWIAWLLWQAIKVQMGISSWHITYGG